ncbi:Fc.00g073140.m01.CDS01 [Cosmosporella sp. VM-42]
MGWDATHARTWFGSVRRMQEHCRKQHGWVNDWKKGGNVVQRAGRERPPVPWRDGVSCQRLCKWGHGKRWFEVGWGGDDPVKPPAIEGHEWDAEARFFHRIHWEDEEAFESEAKAPIKDDDDKNEANAWLGRCGWAHHLKEVDKEELQKASEPIRDDEPVLQQMWGVLERVLENAYYAAGQYQPGSAELFEIERKESTITTTTPFRGLMEADAWARYKEYWKKLLTIWERLESWERDGSSQDGSRVIESDTNTNADSDTDSDTNSDTNSDTDTETKSEASRGSGKGRGPRPAYRMTIKQERLWGSFREGIVGTVAGPPRRRSQCTAEELEYRCLDAVVGFLDHPFQNGNHYESIIISGLAVMGLEPDGGWVPVTNYTQVYSAIIKVARYLVLYQSMLEREANIRRRQQGMGVDRRQAEEGAEGLFRIMRHKVRRFMIRISNEEDAQPTPMNWIINTRSYGLKIRYTTPGSETINWQADTIIHGHVRLGMCQASEIMHNLVGRAQDTLAQLTMTAVDEGESGSGPGSGPAAAAREALPRIPWSRIEDRHSEDGLGHSFLRDEANEWWTQPGHGWVKGQILKTATRRKEWLAETMDPDCPYREKAVRKYERTIKQFREQIWMLMHMTGGQPGRATEVLELQIWNTMNGGIRNIFIHKGIICFITIYHKRFHKRVVGVVYVVGIAVLAEQEEEVAFMEWFREHKWTSNQVRRMMQKYSTEFSGQELNISA